MAKLSLQVPVATLKKSNFEVDICIKALLNQVNTLEFEAGKKGI
jgi:hypothetical protein